MVNSAVSYRFLSLLYFLCIVILVSACSLNYNDTALAEDISEEIPETILFNFTHTAVRNGLPSFRITAESAETYRKKKETILSGITFIEYDNEGTIITTGTADSAIFFTDTEDAELKGGLYFYSSNEKAKVYSEYLYWNNEERVLIGKPEDTVRLERDSGSIISGKEFIANFKINEFVFNKSVTGVFVTEEENGE